MKTIRSLGKLKKKKKKKKKKERKEVHTHTFRQRDPCAVISDDMRNICLIYR